MADDDAARADLAPVGRAPRTEEERAYAWRALVIGLFNVVAASLAAAGQWASWRTENELGLDLGRADWWRVLAVFAANLAPSGLAVLWCLRWAGIWRFGWRRRLPVLAVAASASAAVRLALLATLRYSPGDEWFVVVEVMFGVLAVVVAVSLALYDFDVGAELRAAEERRRAEAERAERASLDVRRDVSRRLHGGLQQRLVLLTHRIAQLATGDAPADTSAELRALADELDDVREQDVRQLSHELLPAGIDIGLREALFLALGRLPSTVSTSVVIAPEVSGRMADPDGPRLAVPDRLLVLDVVQEGVTNAVRHGAARAITVRLDVDPGETDALAVTLDDDGAGLAGPAPHESGLARLRERLAARGGSLELAPRPEGGCRLTARLPVPSAGAPEGEGA